MKTVYTQARRTGNIILTAQVTHLLPAMPPMASHQPQYGAFWPRDLASLRSAPERAATDIIARLLTSRRPDPSVDLGDWLWHNMYPGCGYVMVPVFRHHECYRTEPYADGWDASHCGWMICDTTRYVAFGGLWDHDDALQKMKSEVSGLSQYAGDGSYRLSLLRGIADDQRPMGAPFTQTDWPAVVMPVTCGILQDGVPIGPTMAQLLTPFLPACATGILSDWQCV